MLNPMRRIFLIFLLLTSSSWLVNGQGAALFEGARLITGDGSAPSRTPRSWSRTPSSRGSDARADPASGRGHAHRSDGQNGNAGESRSPRTLRLSARLGRHDGQGVLHAREPRSTIWSGWLTTASARPSASAIWSTVPICTAAGPAGAMFRCAYGTRLIPARRCFARWVRGSHRRTPEPKAIHPGQTSLILSRRSRKLAPQCRTTPK